jgi:NUMOD4 motif/HNH endonuclease
MEDITPERWLPIAGYEGYYEVSDLGHVRSLDRCVQITGPRPGVSFRRGQSIRTFVMKSNGYLSTHLCRDGKMATRTVHSLVLEAFVGPAPPGMEGRHLNGNREDPRAVNLAWGTKSENALDQVAHGTHHCARKDKCLRGHDYDYVMPGTNKRRCKKCRRINDARRKGVP